MWLGKNGASAIKAISMINLTGTTGIPFSLHHLPVCVEVCVCSSSHIRWCDVNPCSQTVEEKNQCTYKYEITKVCVWMHAHVDVHDAHTHLFHSSISYKYVWLLSTPLYNQHCVEVITAKVVVKKQVLEFPQISLSISDKNQLSGPHFTGQRP